MVCAGAAYAIETENTTNTTAVTDARMPWKCFFVNIVPSWLPLRNIDHSPRTLPGLDLRQDLAACDVNERHVVGRTVRRKDRAAIRRYRDAPRALAGGHFAERLVRLRVDEQHALATAGRGEQQLAVRRDCRPHWPDRRATFQLDGLEETMRFGINHGDRRAVLGWHVGTRAVRQERRGALPLPDFKRLQQLQVDRVDRGHLVVAFGGDVDDATIGPDVDALRLVAHLERAEHFPAVDVERGGSAHVFVGDEEALAIRCDGDLFGIRATGDRPDQPQVLDAHHADSVGALVWRRQLAFVDAGSGDGRTAERDIKHGTVGSEPQATRPFTDSHRRDELLRPDVDDAEVTAALVADEQLRPRRHFAWRRGRRSRRWCGGPRATLRRRRLVAAGADEGADNEGKQTFHD